MRRSVQEDWIAWLPAEKRRLYEEMTRRWEEAYAMLSVSLNDALSFRERGELGHALENIRVSAGLVSRLAEPLLVACQVLEARGRHLSTSPSVAPLSPANFRTQVARHAAGWDNLLHRILFASRSRYAHKLRSLQFTISTLAEEFIILAEDLGAGLHTHPGECWLTLDSLHYDLNTCLRETLVLLKSFLRAVPDTTLESVCNELNACESPDVFQARPRLSRASTH
ncbi:MAG TPA: hypothetical protein VGR72_08135 [Candidatus Acidoferrales bacterium]|nr:hypothetical protein [Candidatus Acidoferrales bacterium]